MRVAATEPICVRHGCEAVGPFYDEAGNETKSCPRCLARLGRRLNGEAAVDHAERDARMETIRARVKRRRQRLRGRHDPSKRAGAYRLDVKYSRCQLPRRPETVAEQRTTVAPPACGALVFAGEELEHAEEVHGWTGAVDRKWFTPVQERRDTDDEDAA